MRYRVQDNHNHNIEEQGFTLIELMITIAIIGILAALALSTYNALLIRTKVTEGLQLSSSAKMLIASGIATKDDLYSIADSWNKQAQGHGATSKYVDSVLIDKTTGVITISYSADSIGISASQNQITLSPWMKHGNGNGSSLEQALQQGKLGSLDWGCRSSTSNVADSSHIDTIAPTNPLQNIYAPAQCR